MDSFNVPVRSSSNARDDSHDDETHPGSSRHTSHAGKQSGLNGLGYGLGVFWHHLRPFIPFFLISCLVVALVYLLQAIVFGGPFTDPHFFVKFNERWPRPDPNRQGTASSSKPLSLVQSSKDQELFGLLTGNGTV